MLLNRNRIKSVANPTQSHQTMSSAAASQVAATNVVAAPLTTTVSTHSAAIPVANSGTLATAAAASAVATDVVFQTASPAEKATQTTSVTTPSKTAAKPLASPVPTTTIPYGPLPRDFDQLLLVLATARYYDSGEGEPTDDDASL